MPDPSTLRDSTQIVLPAEDLDGLGADLEEEFVVTVFPQNGESPDGEEYVRIIGSPVEIKDASEYLARHGVSLP